MALDPNVFNNQKTYLDFARAEEEFQAKKALQAATIQEMQAKAQAALQPDIEKLGQQAYLKAAQGMPISAQEGAALKFLDAKSQTVTFNPVTGAREDKPSLLQRSGLAFEQPAASSAMPQSRASAPMSNDSAAQMNELFGAQDNVMPTQSANTQKNITPSEDIPQEVTQELAKYPNNPKMQQSIRETYAKNQINATSPENKFKYENSLRDEFTNTTKDFRTVQDAYSKIKKTSSTGAGDMSMLYSYVKLLDPGSVVRESEFATAAASGSLGERIQGAYKSISQGGRLPESLRNEFLNEATNIYNGQKEGYDRAIKTYKGLAERNKVNPENVVTDYRQLNPIPPQSSTGVKFLGFE